MVKVKVIWFVAFLYVCVNEEDYLNRLLIQVSTTACLYQQQKIEKNKCFIIETSYLNVYVAYA